MRIVLYILIFIFCSKVNFAQVGIGNDNPNSNSLLHIYADQKGVLIPRMTTAQRIAISNVANSLMVFDTDHNQFFIYHSAVSKWYSMNPWITVRTSNAGVSHVRNSNSGNIGIDTTNPSQSLQVNGVMKANDFEGRGALPVGFIGMWSGSVSSLPDGWALCDGKNGTPDLSGQFVVGAGNRKTRHQIDDNPVYESSTFTTLAVGTMGGGNEIELVSDNTPSHTHTYSGSTNSGEGSHSHYHAVSKFGATSTRVSNNVADDDNEIGTYLTGYSYWTTSAGAHSHSFTLTTNNAGGTNVPDSTWMPDWYGNNACLQWAPRPDQCRYYVWGIGVDCCEDDPNCEDNLPPYPDPNFPQNNQYQYRQCTQRGYGIEVAAHWNKFTVYKSLEQENRPPYYSLAYIMRIR